MKTQCQRCGCAAQGRGGGNPDAMLLRRAVKGVCVHCGVVLFLQQLAARHAAGTFPGLPKCLRLPHVQRQFEAVMRVGNADALPDEIDWDRVIELWDIAPPAKETLW